MKQLLQYNRNNRIVNDTYFERPHSAGVGDLQEFFHKFDMKMVNMKKY